MIDAHNHLHDARLDPWREDLLRELPALGVRRAVVNGTRESDWAAVSALAAKVPWIRPSFGLHPWYVKERSAEWRTELVAQLDAHPGCGVGEIGLDRWIEGHDPAVQAECFEAQLELAAERNLPATIHCLRAWGALWDVLREGAVPARGFLLHAYGGPAEMAPGFAARGAYFSFSTSFLHERKAAQRAVFAALPAERILVETDAPDLAPPAGYHELPGGRERPLNHPANIEHAYAALARIRGVNVERLGELVAENFARWFGES
jgi:TatD DNase family protein